MEDFIEILNELILNSGLSLRQLQKESGVSAMQYSDYLKGSIPKIEVALRIAIYFDCTLDYLFGVEENKGSGKYKTASFDLTNFVEKYKKVLNINKITHYKFAKANDISESCLRHWKYGQKPTLYILTKIALNLSTSIDYLIGRK